MSKHAAIYLRISVSQDEDVSHSVEFQLARCTELCELAGYVVAHIYVDDGVSAYVKGSKRKGWKSLRQAVQARDFDVLVFDRQDRLARIQLETMSFIVDCGTQQIAWHSVDEGKIDLSDPLQVMMSVLRGGQAQEYSDKISMNATKANEARRQRGQMFASGATPFGFNADRRTLNEPEAALIRAGVEMINNGQPLLAVVKMFRESSLRPRRSETWQYISVRDMLTPWRNAAVVSFQDEPTDAEAQWDSIVTREQLETCRAVLLAAKGQRRMPSRLLSGVAVCECGEWMSGNNRNGKPHYSCSARQRGLHLDRKHVSIRVDQLDAAVIAKIVELYQFGVGDQAPPEAEDDTTGALIASTRAELAKVDDDQAKLLRLRDSFPEAQLMTEGAKLNTQRAELAERLSELVAADAAATMRAVVVGELYEDVNGHKRGSLGLPGADDIRARFLALPVAKRRELVRTLLSVQVGPGRSEDRISITRRALPVAA